ncbi:hypothetical protein AB1Y20_016909 [Prymnesium parvum]|uniref:Armadillo repeat-containing protein 8 n=1 Tax=Prymnesium parvum TaxID=97485 RepID=A0AB34ICR1_PRYPA
MVEATMAVVAWVGVVRVKDLVVGVLVGVVEEMVQVGVMEAHAMMSDDMPSARHGSVAKSKIYQTIAQARASLSEPSRPFTPAEPHRHLFRPSGGVDAAARPSSAFKIGASSFVVGGAGASLRPSAAGEAEVLSLRDDEAPPPGQQRWWEQVEALLHELRAGAPAEPLLAACDALWEELKPPHSVAGPAGATPAPAAEQARRRKRLLAVLGALMERKEAAVLLRLCRLVLVVAGEHVNALLGACKLAFKLSKTEANDRLYRELGLLPLLLGIVQNVPALASKAVLVEAALYAAGALKNTSSDAHNQRALVSLGAVGAFAAVLHSQMEALAPLDGAPPSPRGAPLEAASPAVRPVHLLVQLSATLRNLAVSGSSRKQFVGSGCVHALCKLLALAPRHAELCLNVSRVLAKLSLHEDVRAQIDADPRHLEALMRVLQLHHADWPLLVRVCFILGNLSASNCRTREEMATALLPQLLQLLARHADEVRAAASAKEVKENRAPPALPPPPHAAPLEESGAAGQATIAAATPRLERKESREERKDAERQAEQFDVLVKLIRLIAHLAISRSVGERIAAAPELLSLLLLLDKFAPEGQQEELVLNTVSAITNVTFYTGADDTSASNVLLAEPSRLVRVLLAVMSQPNEEGVVEACRALGNLSRREEVRHAICAEGAHEALLALLTHPMPPVVEAACGALINLAADSAQTQLLLDARAAPRLAALQLRLLSAPPADPSASHALVLATKTMCNLCFSCTETPLPWELQEQLLPLLEHAVPPAWLGHPHAFVDERSANEWQQASQLQLMLISQLPSTDVGTEVNDCCSHDELDVLPASPDCD